MSAQPRRRTLLDDYRDRFVGKFGDKPVIRGGQDDKLMKELARLHGEGRVIELLDAFFHSTDPFIRQSGYGVGAFYVSVNKLITSSRSTAAVVPHCRHKPRCSDAAACTSRRLRERDLDADATPAQDQAWTA